MVTITDIKKEVIRLCQTYPEARYQKASDGNDGEQCKYTEGLVINGPEGRQGCVVGQAMTNLGLEYEEKDCKYGGSSATFYRLIKDRLLTGIDYTYTSENDRNRKFISEVQCVQDKKDSWGDALNAAYNLFPDANM